MSGVHKQAPERPSMAPGAVIQVQPGTALWQAGNRFGEVVQARPREGRVLVHLDRGNRLWVNLETVLEC